MSVAIGVLIGLAAIGCLFYVLQRMSDRTYRPSALRIKEIVEASIEGHLDLSTFDEFSCVRIAYDTNLDKIRERFNAIVEDKAHIEGEITNANSTPLNATGKEMLKDLVRELERLAAQQVVPADVARPAGERRG